MLLADLVQPFVHPDTDDIDGKMKDLAVQIPNRRGRPVYVCVRSYQSWLENALEQIGAEPGPSQALMVKHLTVPDKSLVYQELPSMEGRQPEVTASSVAEKM